MDETEILTIIYDPSIEFELDQEEVVTNDLPLQALRLKEQASLTTSGLTPPTKVEQSPNQILKYVQTLFLTPIIS